MIRNLHSFSFFILALAAFLRFYLLDGQSFWNDEGNSARIAERSLQLITEGAAGDIHPPLYYYLLHFWRGVFGSSEFALRSLSAVLGVLLVGLTFLIGRKVFSAGVGLLAAFVAAINPFQIYYSQEARMYMLLAVIGAAATLLLLRLLEDWSIRDRGSVDQGSGRGACHWSLIIVSLIILYALGLYTHYAFPFIIVTHFLIVLVWTLVTRAPLALLHHLDRSRRGGGRAVLAVAADGDPADHDVALGARRRSMAGRCCSIRCGCTSPGRRCPLPMRRGDCHLRLLHPHRAVESDRV